MQLKGYPRIIVSAVVATTATAVVGSVIASNVPPPVGKIDTINLKVGGYVLGLTAGAIAAKYTLDYIDETLVTIEMIKNAVKAQTN